MIRIGVVLLALALAVILAVGGGAVLRSKQPAWSLEGRLIIVDSCVIGCRCLLGEPPTHPTCQDVGIFHVDRGNYGSVRLDDTNFAAAGEAARPTREARWDRRFRVFYVDAKATGEQRKALKMILSGPPFTPAPVKEVAINLTGLEGFGQVGHTYGGTVGDLAKVEVTPVEGGVPGKPLVVEYPANHLPHWVAVGKATNSFYKGEGRNFQFNGTAGESFKFSFNATSPRLQ